jgi:hypothetical protein
LKEAGTTKEFLQMAKDHLHPNFLY